MNYLAMFPSIPPEKRKKKKTKKKQRENSKGNKMVKLPRSGLWGKLYV